MAAAAAGEAAGAAVRGMHEAWGRASLSLGAALGRNDGAGGATTAVAATAIVAAAVGGWWLTRRRGGGGNGTAGKRFKSATEIGGGNIENKEIKNKHKEYDGYFQQENGQGVADPSKAPGFVATFYHLVTDFYEWGWGQSFHFACPKAGQSYHAALAEHEEFLADMLKAKGSGKKLLDVGCGVGGPMRTIAAHTQAHVTGITINDYQVSRARLHNNAANLDHLTTVVEGNFLHMPFDDNTFDGIYSIEATCHAPTLEEVYAECFRVLKPGGYYATYEWVKTPKYDPANPQHVGIIDRINAGNALVNMRTQEEAVAAAKAVGFEVIESFDRALEPSREPWHYRLKRGRWVHHISDWLVSFLSFFHVLPAGTKDVHRMLVDVAVDLVDGADTGVFSPMFLVLCRKPAARAT
eukprot:jgi/Chlat1/2358/Chrsp17S02626